MGPNHGPGFVQEYTNQIRKFTLQDNGKTITISHLPAETDSVNLHRRDYNVTAQIMANGQEGITAFSGVFQATVNLPFLNSVNIDRSGYIVNNSFSQYYNNYQCADVPLYSALNNEMHTLFFGGIAQYCDSSGILVQNNNVSFVKTISRVTRTSIGTMTEYKLPVQMPDFMGAGSEFIPIETIPRYGNGVIKLDDLKDDNTIIGYIYGGINSTAENIFWINNGNQSTASPQIFKVLLTKNGSKVPHHKNEQSTGTLKMMAYPDPYNDNFIVTYNLKQMSEVKLSLISIDGIKVEDTVFKKQPVGENTFEKKITNLSKGGTFLLTIDAGYEKAVQKIIVEP
jgi:hypothetical protein